MGLQFMVHLLAVELNAFGLEYNNIVEGNQHGIYTSDHSLHRCPIGQNVAVKQRVVAQGIELHDVARHFVEQLPGITDMVGLVEPMDHDGCAERRDGTGT
jgi:hypothetical protein